MKRGTKLLGTRLSYTGIPEHKFSDQTVFQNTATSSTEVKKKKKKKIRSTKSQYSYTTKTTY